MTIWLLIYAVAAGQAMLLAAALWRRPADRNANRFLAAWMLLVCIDLGVRAWSQVDNGVASYKPMRLVSLFPFLHASAFYLYVRTLISGDSLRWRDLIHALGFLVALACTLEALMVATEASRRAGEALTFWRFGPWSNLLLFGYSMTYIAIAVRAVLQQRRRLRHTQSDRDPDSLRWLMVVAASQCGIWTVALANTLLPPSWLANETIYVAVAAWVLLAGYLSLLQPESGRSQGPTVDSDGTDTEIAADSAQLADEDPRSDEVAARLEALMEQGIYRETALSIGALAKRAGYPEYLVSAVINRRFGCPFWDYINRYRVAAARVQLLDPAQTRTALEIAYDCGFSSKSTFNAAFKRFVGQTPSQCRQQAGR